MEDNIDMGIDEDEYDMLEEVTDDMMLLNDSEADNLEDIADQSALTFRQHKASVFSSDISQSGKIAISGGEDDAAFVWSIDNGGVLFECSGHKDSVTDVAFNRNDTLVATGDMSGLVQVWQVSSAKLIWCTDSEDFGDDLQWLLWHPLADVLLYGGKSGTTYMWQVAELNSKLKVFSGSGVSCSAGAILPDGKQLLTAYGDGTVKLLELKSSAVVWQTKNDFTAELTAVLLSPDASMVVCAPSAQMLKTSDGRLLHTYLAVEQAGIETMKFDSDPLVLVTADLRGSVHVWDVGRHVVRHKIHMSNGISVITGIRRGLVALGTLTGVVLIYDTHSGALVATLTGHTADILSLCCAPDSTRLVTTSEDTTAKVFVLDDILQ